MQERDEMKGENFKPDTENLNYLSELNNLNEPSEVKNLKEEEKEDAESKEKIV